MGVVFAYLFLYTGLSCKFVGTLEKKDFCYQSLAVKNNKVEICDNIKNDYSLEHCYKRVATFFGDEYICRTLPILEENGQTIKNDCFLEVALRNIDTSICQNIPADVRGKFGTRDYCYVVVGIEKKDPSICDEMSGGYVSKEICIKRINSGSNEIME